MSRSSAALDPIQFDGGLNFYSYTGNNPINYNDPLGLQTRSDSRNRPGDIENARRLAEKVKSMGCPGGCKVYVCCRPVDIPIVSFVSRVTGINHCYIKTPNVSAGMGPAGGGPLPLNPIGVPTTINDHSTKLEVIAPPFAMWIRIALKRNLKLENLLENGLSQITATPLRRTLSRSAKRPAPKGKDLPTWG